MLRDWAACLRCSWAQRQQAGNLRLHSFTYTYNTSMRCEAGGVGQPPSVLLLLLFCRLCRFKTQHLILALPQPSWWSRFFPLSFLIGCVMAVLAWSAPTHRWTTCDLVFSSLRPPQCYTPRLPIPLSSLGRKVKCGRKSLRFICMLSR